ncbi:NUDIX hydrolase [Candidatus Parcubacteria bacterium]|nr:NUDIX hydrolase [Candidatus Parcubacteria bacterium]
MRTIAPKNAKLLPQKAKRVFKGQIFDVYQWRQKMFDGSLETFEMLKRTDTIKIIAIKDDEIVVLEEEQPPHPPFIAIPGGRHDKENETELEAAKRELLEETGMKFKNWRLLSVDQPHTKIDWFVYVFLATEFESQTEQNLDAGERIEVKLYSFEEVKDLLSDPKNRYLPKKILEEVNSLQELKNYPEYLAN